MNPGTIRATGAAANAQFAALTEPPTALDVVLRAVRKERARQEKLHGPKTCASSGLPTPIKLAVLTKEVGEVAKWICEHWGTVVETDDLRAELIQVAAVAVAWAESLTD